MQEVSGPRRPGPALSGTRGCKFCSRGRGCVRTGARPGASVRSFGADLGVVQIELEESRLRGRPGSPRSPRQDSACSHPAGLVLAFLIPALRALAVLVEGVLLFEPWPLRFAFCPAIKRVRMSGLLGFVRSPFQDCCCPASFPWLSGCEDRVIALGVPTHGCPMNPKQKPRRDSNPRPSGSKSAPLTTRTQSRLANRSLLETSVGAPC
jgi:hypothetical protein